MDFETAVKVAKQIEDNDEFVVVAGFRRTRPERIDSWALDVLNPDSGKMVTIDEKDDWERMLKLAMADPA
jgi:hypothetical protein